MVYYYHNVRRRLLAWFVCFVGAKAQKATCDANSCMADLKAVVAQGYDEDNGYYGGGNTIPPLRKSQAAITNNVSSCFWEQ
jgi:hypothetical protein